MGAELRGLGRSTAISFLAFGLGTHHLEELSVIYQPIPILVDLADESVDLLIREGLILALQAHFEFLGANGARMVFVKVHEGLLDLPLFGVVLGVHASGDKFGVVDNPVVVGVNYLHCLLNIVYV